MLKIKKAQEKKAVLKNIANKNKKRKKFNNYYNLNKNLKAVYYINN